MSDETITIAFLGVDKRSMSAYEFFFNSIKQIPCELTDDISQSQICLIDKDAYNIQEQYEQFKQDYPEKFILVLSLDDYSCSNDKEFFLKKPVKRDALQATLNQIYNLMSGKSINIIPTLNKTPEQKSAITINDEATTINDEATQKVKINVENNQLKFDVIHDQTMHETIDEINNSITTIKQKRKAVTAKAGKLLKIADEKDFVGVQADIDINDQQQLKKIFYDPGKFLQSIIEKIIIKSRQTESIIQLNVLNHVFYFDYQEQTVYSTVGPGIIRPLCLIPTDHQTSYKIKDPAFRVELHEIIQSNKNKKIKKTREKQSWNMESFMWLITLWSARGRLPKGTSLTDPVYLMQWPNLTRLDSIPHAVRIAALLYEKPHTLPDTAHQLGIEQRYVFAFYSACKTIGLANISHRQTDNTFAPEIPVRHKNKSILSKLLGKLVRFRDKSKMTEIA